MACPDKAGVAASTTAATAATPHATPPRREPRADAKATQTTTATTACVIQACPQYELSSVPIEMFPPTTACSAPSRQRDATRNATAAKTPSLAACFVARTSKAATRSASDCTSTLGNTSNTNAAAPTTVISATKPSQRAST